MMGIRLPALQPAPGVASPSGATRGTAGGNVRAPQLPPPLRPLNPVTLVRGLLKTHGSGPEAAAAGGVPPAFRAPSGLGGEVGGEPAAMATRERRFNGGGGGRAAPRRAGPLGSASRRARACAGAADSKRCGAVAGGMRRGAPRGTLRGVLRRHKPQLRLAASGDLLIHLNFLMFLHRLAEEARTNAFENKSKTIKPEHTVAAAKVILKRSRG